MNQLDANDEMPRIGIIVDNPKRDLDGAALLAASFAEHGFSTALVPMYSQGIDIPLLGLSGVILNYVRMNNRSVVEGYRSLGIRIYVLDTEGGVLCGSGRYTPDQWALWLRDTNLIGLVDHYFCWGSEIQHAFRQLTGAAPDTFSLTGCPRFDFCHATWRDFLDFPHRDYVLINTSFSALNPLFHSSEQQEVEALRGAGFSDPYIEQLLSDLKRSFAGFLDSIETLAEALPDERFVLRPHPFEAPELYTRRYGRLRNVTVDGRGNVLNAIANAKHVLHLNCGTAVESVLLGKVPINLDYLNSDFLRNYAPLPRTISMTAGSVDDLIDMVRDGQSQRQAFPFDQVFSTHVEPWFYKIDGGAARRVASIVTSDQAKNGQRTNTRSMSRSTSGSHLQPTASQLLQGMIGNVFGSQAAAEARALLTPTRRHKYFAPKELQPKLDRIFQTTGLPRPLQASRARHPLTGAPLTSLVIESRR